MTNENRSSIGQTEAVVKAFNRALPKKPIYYFKGGEENEGKFIGPVGNMFRLQDVIEKTDLGKLFLTNNHETGKPAAYLLVATNFQDWDLKVVELEPFNKRIVGKPDGLIVQDFKRGIDAKKAILRNQPINVLLYQVRNRAVTNDTVIARLKKAMSKHYTQSTALQLLLEELNKIDNNSNEAWKTASIIELTGEDLESKLMVYLHPNPKPKPPAKEPKPKKSSEGGKKKVKSQDQQKIEPPAKIADQISPEAEARKKLELVFVKTLIKNIDPKKIDYLLLDDIRKKALFQSVLPLWKDDVELQEGLIPNFETFITELRTLDDPKKIGIDNELIATQYSAMRSIILGLNEKQSSDFSPEDISLIKTKMEAIKKGGSKEEVGELLNEITGKIQPPSTVINSPPL